MNNGFRRISIGLIFGWLILLAMLPFLLMTAASFLQQGGVDLFRFHLTLMNYAQFKDPIFIRIFVRSLMVAVTTTVFCLLLGYPFAYTLARLPETARMACLFLIIIPFWTSSLIRSYAIITLLKTHGLINQLLLKLHLINQPLHLLYTPFASQVGLIYTLLPFMILPLYATLEKLDWRLLEAARDLGASRARAFWQIVVPLSMPGVLAGVLLVLLPAMTLFYIPEILGGAKAMLLGNLIKNQFLEGNNWPLGSAASIILTLFMVCLILIYLRFTRKAQRELV